MGRNSLPPGFRFHPTDVELVKYYLKRKVLGKNLPSAIADVDIYKYAPWDLPNKSCLKNGDLKWYFFCPRGKKYASGVRTNRKTDIGYWKTTGKDRSVHYKNEIAGTIKTLVFHTGNPPKGVRTDWVMHEYKLEEKVFSNNGAVQDSYVLCVIFKKDGPGPKNGAQYGAPFNEEEWDEDTDIEQETNGVEDILYGVVAGPTSACPSSFNRSAITSSCAPEIPCVGPSASFPSENHVSAYHSPTIVNDNVYSATDTLAAVITNAIPVAPLAPQIPHELDNSVAQSASQVAVEEDNLAATSVAAEVVNREETSLGPQVIEGNDLSEWLTAYLVEDSSNPNGSQDAMLFSFEDPEMNLLMMDDFCDRCDNVEVALRTNGNDIYEASGNLGNLNGHNNYSGDQFVELHDLERPVPYFSEVNVGGQIQPAGFYGNNSQLFDCTDVFNAAELIPDLNPPSPVPLNGSHGFQDQHDSFWMDGGPHKKARRDHQID